MSKTAFLLLLFTSVVADVSPVQKVVQLLTDLEAKVIKEGQESQKTFAAFSEWCEERARNLKFEIATGKSDVEELKADIEKASGAISALQTQVEENTGSIATDEADLKAATHIREVEEKDFQVAEKELMEVVSALERAIAILEREMHKGGAAMMQLQKASGIVEAFRVMVDASLLGSQDADRLSALIQSSQKEDDADDGDWGAPDPEAYKSQSGSIVETLEGLLDKAKDELDDARKKEMNNRHNFEMLKQSLKDEIKFASADLDAARKGLAAQQDAKATAEGDLGATSKELQADESTQSTLHQDCMTKSQDFEAEMKSRAEELKAINEAKKVISEQAGGASDITYSLGQTSFLQLAENSEHAVLRTSSDLANFEAVRFVRKLAEKENSEELMQLSRRMASAMRLASSAGEDPFAKVKGLIRDMIENLERDADTDASHKAYCDKELGETAEKETVKTAEIDKLSTSIDSMTAKSAQLKQEVAQLHKELAELASAQAELTKIRQEEKAEYTENRPEMEKGLAAVKMAMKILRKYYAEEGQAHSAATGAGSSIIGLLEVVESDFSKTMAEMSAAEMSAQAAYDKETRANEIEKATAEQAVKYKTRESSQLDAKTSEAKSDRSSVQAELTAILEYKEKLKQMCVAKPEKYSERKARREAEIAGLKEALSILEGEAVLLQRRAFAAHPPTAPSSPLLRGRRGGGGGAAGGSGEELGISGARGINQVLVEAATAQKVKANRLFKDGGHAEAREAYSKALGYLRTMSRRTEEEDEVCEQAQAVRVALLLNLAACDLKTGDYARVIETCNTVLDDQPDHQKALYRRGVACSHLGRLDAASADLRKVLKTAESEGDAATARDARRELARVKKLVEAQRQEDRAFARRMIGGAGASE
mmetsp:Transcript_148316/g.385594  ORF Transcript_148316/g.385594 Transcript_148316/m.385594 type:complete len:887 (-) Transcript_148316:85-2745(-)